VHADVRPDVEEDVAAPVGELRGPPLPAAAPSAAAPLLHLLPPSSLAGGGRSVGVEVCAVAVRQGRAQIREIAHHAEHGDARAEAYAWVEDGFHRGVTLSERRLSVYYHTMIHYFSNGSSRDFHIDSYFIS